MTAPVPSAAMRASPIVGDTPWWLRAALFAGWLALVLWLAAGHVFWRDEVRALSLALSGNGLVGMLRAVQGEGHPALWYLSLRLAHDLVPVREVLPAMALVFGTGAAALLAFRAPFRPLVIVAALFSGWMAFEYAVMARNYGVAALLMLAIADRMTRGKRNGLVLGLLLALLCNTNVPAVFAAAGFLLFWLIELVSEHGWRPSRAMVSWLTAAALALTGAVACFLEVYPPVNDAAVSVPAWPAGAHGVFAPFVALVTPMMGLVPDGSAAFAITPVLLGLLLLACPLSLARSPAAAIAALAVLLVTVLFFDLVYRGSYRHQAEYLVFVLALHWVVARGGGGRWPARWMAQADRLSALAGGALLVLLVLQVAGLASVIGGAMRGQVASRSRDFGALLHRPDLTRAIVIGAPDVIVESLPYYAANPTWLVREHRYGNVSHFTRRAVLDLTLGDVLATARALQRATGRPIVIATGLRLAPAMPAARWPEGYCGTFSLTPAQVAAFLGATDRLARFGPTTAGESYDVYLLKRPVTAS